MSVLLEYILVGIFMILFIIGIPTIIYFVIKSLNSYNSIELDKNFSLRELFFKLISHPWSFREVLIFLLVLVPLFIYQSLFSFPTHEMIIIGSIIYISWYVINKSTKREESTKELVENLSSMLSRVNDSAVYIEALATTIEKREKEAIKKKKLLEELQNQVQNNKEQANELESLTDKQKELLLDAARGALKPSSISMFGAILMGLLINIVATILWTLADTPGKEQILNLLKTITLQ